MTDSYSAGERVRAGQYLTAFRHHWPLIALIVALAVIPTAVYSVSAPKRYNAQADLVVTPIPADDTTFLGISGLLRDSTQAQTVLTAARVAEAPAVGETVKARLGLSERPQIDVKPVGQSNVVSLVATASNAAQAARIANAYAEAVLSLRAAELERQLEATITRLQTRLTSLNGGSASNQAIGRQIRQRIAQLTPLVGAGDPTMSLLSAAVPPTSASWPRPALSVLVAFICALLLGIGLALALEVLNPVIKDEEELLFGHRRPILARLPRVTQFEIRRFLTRRGELPPDLRESYRMLRGSLYAAGPNGSFPKVILVASAGLEEGKTVTSISLADAIARSGMSVILVDGDLRRPMLGAVYGVSAAPSGLPDLLRGTAKPEETLVPGPSPNLRLLLSTPDPEIIDLVQQDRMASVVSRLQEHADVIVIDSSPLAEFADSYAFANVAEAVIVCVRLGRSNRQRLGDMLRRFAQLHIVPAGFVVISRRRSFAGDGEAEYTRRRPEFAQFSPAVPASKSPAADNDADGDHNGASDWDGDGATSPVRPKGRSARQRR
jgi:capsular exopolysaccharide synthesis family protein